MAWVQNLGFALIKTVTLEIGNQIIDSHTGEWLYLYHTMRTRGHADGLREMTGNMLHLHQYSTEKPPVTLYIPLAFWFCDKSQSIPLCALEYSDINIVVEFNTLDHCLNYHSKQAIVIQDQYCAFTPHEILEQTTNNHTARGLFVGFENGTLYINPIKGTFKAYDANIHTSSSLFTIYGIESNETCIPIDVKSAHNTLGNLNLNIQSAYLVVNYIHLDTQERNNFMTKQQILITRVQAIPDVKITTHARTVSLNSFNNMTKELVWRCIGLDNLNNKQYFYYDKHNYLKSVELMLNGVVRESARDGNYYKLVPFYQHNNSHNISGVYFYVFSLNPSDFQPSGHINFSKIDEIQLNIKSNPIVTTTQPIYLKAYTTSYNYLVFENGMCKILFIN